MRDDRKNLIVDLTLEYALKVIEYSEQLSKLKKFDMASQIFRSGTSIGANIREAQNAESKKDFIHKFKISAKEADELEYWLTLCELSEYYPNPTGMQEDLQSIIKIMSKIISSSKKSQHIAKSTH